MQYVVGEQECEIQVYFRLYTKMMGVLALLAVLAAFVVVERSKDASNGSHFNVFNGSIACQHFGCAAQHAGGYT